MKKKYYYQVFITLLMFLGFSSVSLAAPDNNSLVKQDLIKQLETYILSQLHPVENGKTNISTMPIDSRIHVPECPTGFQFTVNPDTLSQSNITVKAVCDQDNWYMFLVVQASQVQPVVVLNSAVSPGTVLTKQNLSLVEVDKKRLRSTTFADIDQVVGARIKRRVGSGRPITPNDLCYVCKGDAVVISAITSAMEVKTSGIALEDGGIGETIAVKNSRSEKRIHAKVASSGNVEINI